MAIKRRWGAGMAGAMVLTAILAASGTSKAQGVFYVEAEQDGRIYVFNQMKAYEEWKASGEMGRSITRVGEGPNGESLIFDSEEAIHLYNFRHGRPGEVIHKVEEKKPVTKFDWKDGKTTFESDKASLTLSNRIQLRATQEEFEDPAKDDKGSFRVRRARTKLDGWIYTRNLTYELQVDWADNPDDRDPAREENPNLLQDVNINYDLTRGRKQLQIKAGQFKVPFGRQELTSSGSQQFVDRSIVSNEFAKGRDIGLQLWGTPFEGKLDWRVGLFNGNGRTRNANDNDTYQYDARVSWQPFGDLRYSESDFESKDRPLLAVGLNAERNDMHGASSGNDIARDVVGTDVAFKFKGVSAFAEYFRRNNERETPLDEDGDTIVDPDFDSSGLHAQVGIFAIPTRLEFAARWAKLDPNDRIEGNDRTERGIVANWFWNKHNLKLQADWRIVEDEALPAASDRTRELRVQTQWIF